MERLRPGLRRVESDAVVDGFCDSDFNNGGTDVQGYTLQGNYALSRRVSLGLAGWRRPRSPARRSRRHHPFRSQRQILTMKRLCTLSLRHPARRRPPRRRRGSHVESQLRDAVKNLTRQVQTAQTDLATAQAAATQAADQFKSDEAKIAGLIKHGDEDKAAADKVAAELNAKLAQAAEELEKVKAELETTKSARTPQARWPPPRRPSGPSSRRRTTS